MELKTCTKGPYSYRLWKRESAVPGPVAVLLPEPGETAEALEKKAELFLDDAFQRQYGCSLLLPEDGEALSTWKGAAALRSVLFELENTQAADPCRMYLIGGGNAWAVGSRFPRRFAAVIAVGGRADPYAARNLKFTPVWAFGREGAEAEDRKVPASPKHTAAALRACGSRCVRYTGVEGDQCLWQKALGEKAVTDWLFAQTKKNQFEVTYLQPGVFKIDDYFTSSAYLVCGTEKALLIDTGMGEGDLPALVHSLTPLPVEVAITHPHRDHMAQAEKFSRVWFHEGDIGRLEEYQRQMESFFGDQGPSAPAKDQLLPLRDGSKIDLGGGVVIEAVEFGGHTPNSVVFIDGYHKSVYTGDAIGSGYLALMICTTKEWKQVISHYRENLRRFQKHLPELQEYAWLGGHYIQENGCDVERQEDYLSGTSEYFLPLSGTVVCDMEALCEKLLSGEISEQELMNDPGHYCTFGSAGMTFRFTDL